MPRATSIDLLFSLSCSNQHNDEMPGFARLAWTRELGQRIARAHALCREQDLKQIEVDASITFYDALPDALDRVAGKLEAQPWLRLSRAQSRALDNAEERFGMRGDAIVVSSHGNFWLSGYCKYSGDVSESTAASLEDADPQAEAQGYPVLNLALASNDAELQVQFGPGDHAALVAALGAQRTLGYRAMLTVPIGRACIRASEPGERNASCTRAPRLDNAEPATLLITGYDVAFQMGEQAAHCSLNDATRLAAQIASHLSLAA